LGHASVYQLKTYTILQGSIKPLGKDNADKEQEQITQALTCLAADPKNEIWMVTFDKVEGLDNQYDHIPNLNLAGGQGSQFSNHNTESVEHSDPLSMEELIDESSKVIISSKPNKLEINHLQ
jgi:trehalose-6-phosphatase